MALSNFALSCVRQVVESLYPGRVVYAGGDDLLALLPAEYALAAARDLRALYSGQASVEVNADGWKVQPDFASEHDGFLSLGEQVLLTMGPTATASTGIAIAHHQAPLDGVLAAAREAEDAAKEAYDRNAVCVYALKRSGEALRVGSRWYYDDVRDPVGLFNSLRSLLSEDKLSSKLAYDVAREARALPLPPTQLGQTGSSASPFVPLDAVKSALKLQLIRHKGNQISSEDAKKQAGELSPRLTDWARALDAHRKAWKSDWQQRHHSDPREPDPLDEDYAPQPGPVELGKWLLLARFLETGGEE
jgi:CRISPR-associated protein Cmr2